MSLGIVSPQEFEEELKKTSGNGLLKRAPEVIERVIEHGRGHKEETPEVVREIVGIEKALGTSAKELSKEFGLSPSSISAYARGATSTASYKVPDARLKNAIAQAKEGIQSRAQSRLMEALDAIDLSGQIKPNIASAVAKDMSSIVKNMEPDNPFGNSYNQNVIIYKPRMKEESDYEIIEVQE